MMRTQQAGASANRYNEVIVDTTAYTQRLPRSLEAIFTLSRSDTAARAAHTHYLSETGLSASQCPLLLLQISNHVKPFTDIS
jgi:hypothetical protein